MYVTTAVTAWRISPDTAESSPSDASKYYCFRKGITFSENPLSLGTAQMQLCRSCTLCAQTGQRAFGDLQQISADALRRRTAESGLNFRAIGPNAVCPVCAHNIHE